MTAAEARAYLQSLGLSADESDVDAVASGRLTAEEFRARQQRRVAPTASAGGSGGDADADADARIDEGWYGFESDPGEFRFSRSNDPTSVGLSPTVPGALNYWTGDRAAYIDQLEAQGVGSHIGGTSDRRAFIEQQIEQQMPRPVINAGGRAAASFRESLVTPTYAMDLASLASPTATGAGGSPNGPAGAWGSSQPGGQWTGGYAGGTPYFDDPTGQYTGTVEPGSRGGYTAGYMPGFTGDPSGDIYGGLGGPIFGGGEYSGDDPWKQFESGIGKPGETRPFPKYPNIPGFSDEFQYPGLNPPSFEYPEWQSPSYDVGRFSPDLGDIYEAPPNIQAREFIAPNRAAGTFAPTPSTMEAYTAPDSTVGAFTAPERTTGAFQAPAYELGAWKGPDPYAAGTFTAPTATTFHADPGYDFRLNQGLKAITNAEAASGIARSGDALKGLGDYAQAAASQEYGNVFNRQLQAFQTNEGARQNAWDMNLGALATGFGLERGRQGDIFSRALATNEAGRGYDNDIYAQAAGTHGINLGQDRDRFDRSTTAYGLNLGRDRDIYDREATTYGIQLGADAQNFNQNLAGFDAGRASDQDVWGRWLGAQGERRATQGQQYTQARDIYDTNAGAEADEFDRAERSYAIGLGRKESDFSRERDLYTTNLGAAQTGFGLNQGARNQKWGQLLNLYDLSTRNMPTYAY